MDHGPQTTDNGTLTVDRPSGAAARPGSAGREVIGSSRTRRPSSVVHGQGRQPKELTAAWEAGRLIVVAREVVDLRREQSLAADRGPEEGGGSRALGACAKHS